MTFDQAFNELRRDFGVYVKNKVLTKVDTDNLGKVLQLVWFFEDCLEIFYVGLPPRKFPDFKKLAEYIFGGHLLEQIGATEALDSESVLN